MREAQENRIWDQYGAAVPSAAPITIALPSGNSLEFRQSCTIVAGRNGTGKTRLLRTAAAALGTGAILIELSHLTQLVLNATSSRNDYEEMTDEFSPIGPNVEQLSDLRRVVGRDYASVSWFALELELAESFDPDDTLRWGDEEQSPLLPYFTAEYRSVSYSSLGMGLGEFAVHLLFWVLDQYRDKTDLVLLLDEPDAYLPPIASSSLLARLLAICLKRGWRLVMSTHSDELIRQAASRGALMLLGVDDTGATIAQYSDDNPNIAEHLLTRSPIENVLFCEDESAWFLTSEILRSQNKPLWRSTSIVWGKGEGGLRALHTHLPRPPGAEVRFAPVFDGDQRGNVSNQPGEHWSNCFLPTETDPDELFRSLASSPAELALELGTSEDEIRGLLETLEGADSHDWVNRIGEEYGRQIGLSALARLWVKNNSAEAATFVTELLAGWAQSSGS